MSHLVPCPECRRHVRVHEAACPFCGAALELSALPAPALPTLRLGRAALFAFGATLAASVAASGCGGDTDDGKEGSGGTTAGGSGGRSGSGGASGTGGSTNTGGTGDSANTGGAGNVGPVYGIPADSGIIIEDAQATGGAGGAVPLYGAAPP
jgi:hypothetical protein